MAELEVSMADGEYYYDVDPCPFCGKDVGEFVDSTQYIFVLCNNCGACGPNELNFKRAAAMWNMRRKFDRE